MRHAVKKKHRLLRDQTRTFASLEDGPLVFQLPPSEGPLPGPSADVPHNDVLGVIGVIHCVAERHQVPGKVHESHTTVQGADDRVQNW